MLQNYLLPNKYKKWGWFILIPSLIVGLFTIIHSYEPHWLNVKMVSMLPDKLLEGKNYFEIVDVNLLYTIIGVGIITGGLLVGFSKQKNEDEYIASVRLASLLWAVLVNYSLLILAFVLIYETSFLQIMVYNMFTILLLFIARFYYLLFKNKPSQNEK